MLALTATRLYTPLECIERPVVLIEGETILEIFSQAQRSIPGGSRVVDFGDATLVPGFVDTHIHGGAGHDLMNADAAGFASLGRLLTAHGVTSYFPTTVTAAIDPTLSALDRLAVTIEQAENRRAENDRHAQPLGIHLEGPFLSHIRRGVHPPAHLQRPSIKLFERFWQAAHGRIRIMTIAPELEGAMEVIAEASRRGVCISLGHTDANLETARAAVAAGARHATHTFNAMRPLNHRDPGIIGAVLTDSRLTADIIADGIHLHPAIVDLFLKAKGPDSTVLITDATAATGMPEGRYRLGDMEVEVKDGRCMAGDKLAGSVLTMDRALQNVMQFAHWSLQDAVRPATLNPARDTRLTQRGKLEAGCVADIAVLNSRGEVKTTIVRGAVPNAAAQA